MSCSVIARVLLPGKQQSRQTKIYTLEKPPTTAEKSMHLGYALSRQTYQTTWKLKKLNVRLNGCTNLWVIACLLAIECHCLNKEGDLSSTMSVEGQTVLTSSPLPPALPCRIEEVKAHIPADSVPGFDDLGVIQLGWRTRHLSKQHPSWYSMLCLHMRHHVIDESRGEFILPGPNMKSFVHITATRKKEKKAR